MRNLKEQVKKSILSVTFTVSINCSNDLKIFANSRPSASNFNSNRSNLLDMRNLKEQVKKALCYQKLF